MATATTPSFQLGQRVVDKNGFIGTVRYVGPVPTSKKAETLYAGIEWDDATRGKHDGSVTKDGEVIRLYSCESGRGSFMKLPLLRTGVSMLAALLDKYEGAKLDGMESVATTSGGFMEVEFVGEDHIRAKQQLRRNQSVSLKDALVGVVEAGEIGELAPNIQELDMRGNLLWNWDDVVRIGQQLTRLQVLNLGSNKMAHLSPSVSTQLMPSFKGLRILILSNTGLPWGEAMRAGQAMPSLEELHMCQNHVALLDGSDARGEESESKTTVQESFPQLRVLNLAENDISSWGEVARLGHLPRLQHLLLHHNQLASIEYDQAEEPALFPHLDSVDLNDNVLDSWASIDQLAKFPALTNVRIQRNPLVSVIGPSVARQLLVARLPSVIRLNQSEVRPRERADAEKGYLRRVSAEFHEAEGVDLFAKFTAAQAEVGGPESNAAGAGGGAGAGASHALNGGHVVDVAATRALIEGVLSPELRDKLVSLHPRFIELLAVHGTAMIAIIKATGSSMSANSATVTLRSMAASSCTVAPVEKKLPLSMTVGTLKTLMSKLFKCDPALQHLAFRPKGVYPSPLDNDMQTLSFYGVCDGGDILLEEIDPDAVRQAEEAAEAERQERLKKQVAGVEARNAAQAADQAARKVAAQGTAAR